MLAGRICSDPLLDFSPMPRTLTFGQSREPVYVASFLHVGGEIERIEDVETLVGNDLIRIEGSVLLTVDSTVLLSDEIVDSVFLIWIYLMDGLARVGRGEACALSYPDLDYPVSLEEVEPRAAQRHVRVTVGRGASYATAVVPWDGFYRSLGKAAQSFVGEMERLAPRFASEYAELRALTERVREYAGQHDARLYGPRAHRR